MWLNNYCFERRDGGTIESSIAEKTRLVAEKGMLSSQISGGHEQQEALTKLLRYAAKEKYLKEFDDGLFTAHVDHIVIFDRSEIGFAMKCGPIFRERI